MLLSIQQRYILDVLRKLGCVRSGQLHALTQGKFRGKMEISEARMEAMLRQLCGRGGVVRMNEEFVFLPNAQPDALRLEAVDVMLELTEGVPEDFSTLVERPGLLRFSWGGDNLRLFTVAVLSAPVQSTVEMLAWQKRVVWISASGTVPEGLALPPKHFFAARLQDGSHRFYGSNGP